MRLKVSGTLLVLLLLIVSGLAWAAPPIITASGDTVNTFLGDVAGNQFLLSNPLAVGTNNTFVGAGAGQLTTSGNWNSAFGNLAGNMNGSGFSNSFFGYAAGHDTTGSFNTFLGVHAGYSNLGDYSTSVGLEAGFTNLAGSNNTFLGARAGYASTGSNNVFLGIDAGSNEKGNGKLYIANSSTPFPLVYGDFTSAVLTVHGTLIMADIAAASDVRYKKEIHPLASSLIKVMQLQGVSYILKTDEYKGRGFKEGRQIGLIAQDVEKVFPELVLTDSKGYKAVSYDKLVPVLIEAMKEQQKGFEKSLTEKDTRIEKLEKALDAMEKRLASVEQPGRSIASK
ncbi:MAG: hypothetical protein C0402_11495 [Thermodesulfovibrio sp.]|nr:hypothetical protein [Thermodesulfovibrio sp.]